MGGLTRSRSRTGFEETISNGVLLQVNISHMYTALGKLARAVGVPVGRRSGGQTGIDVSGHKNVFFPVSPPSQPFLIGVLGSKNLFRKS